MNTVSNINSKRQELLKQVAELDKELEIVKKQERQRKIELNEKKLNEYRNKKDLLLSLFEHDGGDCSDEHPVHDDFDRRGLPECNKCFLIKILEEEWNNEYVVNIDLSIYKL